MESQSCSGKSFFPAFLNIVKIRLDIITNLWLNHEQLFGLVCNYLILKQRVLSSLADHEKPFPPCLKIETKFMEFKD